LKRVSQYPSRRVFRNSFKSVDRRYGIMRLNFVMKRVESGSRDVHRLSKFGGPAVTVAASLPKELVDFTPS